MFDPPIEENRHIGHRKNWTQLAQKKLPELGNKSIVEYVKENTNIDNPSMFIASLFEEGLASKIYDGESIARDGRNGRMPMGGDPSYPYSGFLDFGLDTVGSNLDSFIKKGYVSNDIKDRIKLVDTIAENGNKVTSADFKNFRDVLEFKIGYLKESENNLNNYTKENNIPLSNEAKEYFKYVGYNAGVGNQQKMIQSFNEKGYLKDDKFLNNDFVPEYWKEPYDYSMRRYQASKMLQDNISDLKPKLNRVKSEFISVPTKSPVNNKISMNNNTTVNPVQQFFLGGAFNQENMGTTAGVAGMLSGFIPTQTNQGLTSVGGNTASGALKGAASLAGLGPWGAIGGAVLGGATSFIQANKQRKEQEEQLQLQRDSEQRQRLANLNYGVGQASNLPMANGGNLTSNGTVNPIGSFTLFENGGTHEQNPYGGIPQGYNKQGQIMTTEEGESRFKFKDSDYIFSDRLTFE